MTDCRYEVYTYGKELVIEGQFSSEIDRNVVHFISPSPPDYRSSFSGSALPYASKKQAYDNTPNIGHVKLLTNNSFVIKLAYPNAYYGNFSNELENPYVLLSYSFEGVEKTLKIELGKIINNIRTLRHHVNHNEMFYDNESNLEIRSQEKILRDSQFKNTNNTNSFWGLRPPV